MADKALADLPLDKKKLEKRRKLYHDVAPHLRELYGYPEWRQHLPPVDELVSTILSQNTSDINRDKGFYALKDAFPDWETVRDAPVDLIRETIRPAGLANQKAPRIQNALQIITSADGKVSLDHIPHMTVNEARAWLTSIKGIGPKTASIILLFAFKMPAFPVDTHVHRVSGRLGFIDEKTSADNAHPIMEAIVPEEDYYAFHLNIIEHGRAICGARKAKCEICPLTAYCHYYKSIAKKG